MGLAVPTGHTLPPHASASPPWRRDGKHGAGWTALRPRGLSTGALAGGKDTGLSSVGAAAGPQPALPAPHPSPETAGGASSDKTSGQKTEPRMTQGQGAQAPQSPPRACHCHRGGPACPHKALAW